MTLVHYCNKIIEYSFYAIFFLVPLLFSQYTSELFELNKIWMLYFLTIIIFGAWVTKMILEKEIYVKRTWFDIPIILFLISQTISTVFSLDQHVSFYGYYSRFNGGLLSFIAFVFLYYAFVSNFSLREVWKGLTVTLWTGVVVALWGLPSHFGNDPTCLLFRGTFDTSCWTEAFHPTSRIFSTLGQPAWLAAYLAMLLPIAMFYALRYDPDFSHHKKNITMYWVYIAVVLLFILDLIFANTRAGYFAFLLAYITFWAFALFWKSTKQKKIIILGLYTLTSAIFLFFILKSMYMYMHLLILAFVVAIFFVKRSFTRTFIAINVGFFIAVLIFGTPLGRPEEPLTKLFSSAPSPAAPAKAEPAQPTAGTVLDVNITDSGTIRRIVWNGALDIWKAHPIFGTGVETFAFAYYKFRPVEHNLTSEWDYLYNKAHNEYLNYLATTGIFGLGTHLLLIGFVGFFVLKLLYQHYGKQTAKADSEGEITEEHYLAIVALAAGFLSILITNFFGFSVVIINLYFFLIPAMLLFLTGRISDEHTYSMRFGSKQQAGINPYQWTYITILGIVCCYFLLTTFRTWQADKAYALGYNLSRVGDFQNSYIKLDEAVKLRPAEPIFRDEFAVTNATIATILYENKDAVNAPQFAQRAIQLTDEVTAKHPNNIIFMKDRFKVFYLLASVPSEQQGLYRQQAILSLQKALALAPKDAKLYYNLGVVYKESGDKEAAIQALKKSVALKNDYRDAYYALGLAYRDAALGPNGTVINPEMQQNAEDTMREILEKFEEKSNGTAEQSLREWGVLGASAAAR